MVPSLNYNRKSLGPEAMKTTEKVKLVGRAHFCSGKCFLRTRMLCFSCITGQAADALQGFREETECTSHPVLLDVCFGDHHKDLVLPQS